MNNVDPSRVAVMIKLNAKTGSYSLTKKIYSTKQRRYISDVRHGQPAFFTYKEFLIEEMDKILNEH